MRRDKRNIITVDLTDGFRALLDALRADPGVIAQHRGIPSTSDMIRSLIGQVAALTLPASQYTALVERSRQQRYLPTDSQKEGE